MVRDHKEIVLTIPNALTLLRIGLAFSILWLLAEAHGKSLYLSIAFVLCLIAAITDALDGYLARRLKQESATGKDLDPAADKVLVYFVLFPLSLTYDLIPLWLVMVICARDIMAFSLTKVVTRSGGVFNVTFFAKVKTTVQDVFILSGILILIFSPVDPLIMEAWNVCIYVVGILTVMTLFHYAWVNRESLRHVR